MGDMGDSFNFVDLVSKVGDYTILCTHFHYEDVKISTSYEVKGTVYLIIDSLGNPLFLRVIVHHMQPQSCQICMHPCCIF